MDPGQLYQVKVAQNAAFEEPDLMQAALKPHLGFEFCPASEAYNAHPPPGRPEPRRRSRHRPPPPRTPFAFACISPTRPAPKCVGKILLRTTGIEIVSMSKVAGLTATFGANHWSLYINVTRLRRNTKQRITVCTKAESAQTMWSQLPRTLTNHSVLKRLPNIEVEFSHVLPAYTINHPVFPRTLR
jgi:hypothetical protein